MTTNDDSIDAQMSVLGTMMLRAGLLSESQVAAANEQAATNSTSHVDAILDLGLADEDTMVAFLASKLMIPRVRSAVLERVDQHTLARVSPLLAWDHKCVPVSADETGNLTVVMADPTDPRAIDALVEQTGAYLVRAVSTVSDIRRALERHYGTEHAVRERAAAQQARAATRESERTTELELQPIRGEAPPPGYAGPTGPAPADPIAPYMAHSNIGMAHSNIGVPEDDDDDVPVRTPHAAAEEINSGPHDQAYDEPAHEDERTYDEPAPADTPQPDAWGPPPAADDIHTRPTVIEAQQPASSRGPRRPRAHTPWNPPLAGGANPHAEPAPAPVAAPTPPAAEVPAPEVPAPEAPAPAPPVSPPPVAAPTPPPPAAAPPPPQPAVAPPPPQPAAAPIPLSPEAFAQVLPQLEAATDRDEVTTLLLDFLGAGFERVILFVHSHNELRGLDARGKDLLVEAVRQVRIPTTGQSMFSETIERGSPYFGPARGTSKIDAAFAQALGGIKGNLLLLPITLGSKVPLLLWAHGVSHPIDPRSINELSACVSTAILRIIAAARRKG